MLPFRFRSKIKKPVSERYRAQPRLEALELRINLGRIEGYFTEWSVYDRGYAATFIPSTTDVIHYAFIRPTQPGTPGSDPNFYIPSVFDTFAALEKTFPDCPAYPCGNFKHLAIYKQNHPNVRVNMALGGWTLSTYFSDIAADAQRLQNWVTGIHDLMLRYRPFDRILWDGVDVDWEYPGFAHDGIHTRPDDGVNFMRMMQELRRQFDIFGAQDGRNYEITAALPAGDDKIVLLPDDLTNLFAAIDHAHVLSLDYHGIWDRPLVTNHNVPLFFSPDDPSDVAQTYFVDSTMRQLLAKNADPAKLDMAVPFYSRCSVGVSPVNNGMYQPATGGCREQYEEGIVDIRLVDDHLRNQPGTYHVFRDVTGEPWVFGNSTVYSYVDNQFLSDMVDYSNSNLSGSLWAWSFDGDGRTGQRINTLADLVHGGGAAPSRSSLKRPTASLLLATPTFVTGALETFATTLAPVGTPPAAETQPGHSRTDSLITSPAITLPHHRHVDEVFALLQEFELLGS
jgi:chitinase